ncbi:putative leucine-rich repeat-containing protein DDB_G0290503 [Homalodisca vitripennis]|uniref:putative leucine-rich repeat-containing protein DDB_G0290503 n=1 Tax=Homalodisca vitripennis TaxID=197043 RepID=UPI001EEC424D|nr:putative leucine-rich repeat-containing protein DDB_G0290503 [Homalodisca vitripennis]
MSKKKLQYPCGKCSKNITKGCHAILCTGTCSNWFHRKCTSLTIEEYKSIAQLLRKWLCEKCTSVDFHLEHEKETIGINQDVTQELINQHKIINSLNDDINQARKEIISLKNHNIQLETLVIKKEETIIQLEEEVNRLRTKLNQKENFNISTMKKVNSDVHHSLSPLNSTPFHDNTGLKKSLWSSEKTKLESFSVVVKSKKNIPNPIPKTCNGNQNPIELRNQFEVLQVDEDETSNVSDLSTDGSHSETHMNKVLICADSHGRDLAWHLNKIHKDHEAVGFVRPGGRTRQILNYKNIENVNLNKNNYLVMVCGTNDMAKNEANEALTLITETLDRATNTNIILVDLPHRYDLASWSCVNKEVEKTNKRLEELSGRYSNVTLVKSSKAERALHTRQGLHLNFWGKKWLAEVIAKAITAKKDPDHSLGLRDVQPPPPGTYDVSGNCLPIGKNYSAQVEAHQNLRTRLIVYHLNIQCIRNKLEELNLWSNKLNIHVLTINEHWLCPEESLLYVPAGFCVGSVYCRKPPLRRGGCSIYVKRDIM